MQEYTNPVTSKQPMVAAGVVIAALSLLAARQLRMALAIQ
jgi:hypothetical protein